MNTSGQNAIDRARPRGLAAAAVAIIVCLALAAVPVAAKPVTNDARAGAAAVDGVCATAGGVQPAGTGWTVSPIDAAGHLAVTGVMTAQMVFTIPGVVVPGDPGLWQTGTTDGGTCWSEPTEIPDPGFDTFTDSSMASRGQVLHVIARAGDEFDSEYIRYHRSTDGGATWEPAQTVAQLFAASRPELDIAVGANGNVVAWVAKDSDLLMGGVSTDGGDTWGPAQEILQWTEGCCAISFDGEPQVTVSKNVVIITSWRRPKLLVTRRSTDGGQTWSQETVLSRKSVDYAGNTELETRGKKVLAVFLAGGKLRTKMSHNRGATWASGPALATGLGDDHPVALKYVGDKWRLLYSTADGLYYRQSANGTTWSSPELVDMAFGYYDPFSIDMLDGGVVSPMLTLNGGYTSHWARKD